MKMKPIAALPDGYLQLTIGGHTRLIINVESVVAVADAPRGESDVYTHEPGENNSHFRVDEDLETIALKIRDARRSLSTVVSEEHHG